MRLLAVVLIACLAGCTEPSINEVEATLTGAFTSDRTPAEMARLQDEVDARGGDMAIMESFPEQFHISGWAMSDCQEVAAMMDDWDFIASHSGCMA